MVRGRLHALASATGSLLGRELKRAVEHRHAPPEPAAPQRARTERAGTRRAAPQRAGTERAASQPAGMEPAGTDPETLSRSRQRARDVRLTLERLGPFYIKVGQILSTRPDLVSDDMIEELGSLHDRVTVQDFSVFEPVLEAELGPDWKREFADINVIEPLGAASLAQVYDVTLADGRAAVLKVQRPGLHSLMAADMALSRRIVKLATRAFPKLNAVVDLPAALDIVFDVMEAELDFTIEAQNMENARPSVADFAFLDIPDVIHVTPRVLIQSKAPGYSIRDARPADFTDEEREAIGRDLLAYMYHSYFVDKIFHADPHPGNIFVHPGEPAYLIDWGMVGRLDRRAGLAIMLVLLNVAMNDGQGVARAWTEFGELTESAKMSSFVHDMEALIPKVANASLADLNFGVTLTDLLKSSTKRGIRTNPMIAMLAKSFANLEGSIRYLAPMISVTEVFRDELPDIMIQLASEIFSEQQILRTALEFVLGGSGTIEQTRAILQNLANGQFTIQVNQLPSSKFGGGMSKYAGIAVALVLVRKWLRSQT